MRKSALIMGAALAALVMGGQAQATTVVYGPLAQLDVSSLAHQGPNVAVSAIGVKNGTTQYLNVGPSGTANSYGAGYNIAADTYIPGGAGTRTFTSASYGAADLTTGVVKASTATTGGEFFGGPGGDVHSQIWDT